MAIPTVNVTGTIRNAAGAAVSGATVTARLSAIDLYQSQYVYPSDIVATTNGSGAFTLTLFANAIGEFNTQYAVKAQDADGRTHLSTVMVVPNTNTTLDAIAGTSAATETDTWVPGPKNIPFLDQNERIASFLKNFNTSSRSYTFPDRSGTVALINDAVAAGAIAQNSDGSYRSIGPSFDTNDDTLVAFTIPTVAALRALPAPALASGKTMTIRLLGYYTAGDGGGGTFYWQGNSSESDDAGLVIQPNSAPASGRWKRAWHEWVSLRWFGAKGDGVTNDTTAVQRALAKGKVFASAGHYRCSALATSAFILSGAGSETTWFSPWTSGSAAILQRRALGGVYWSYNTRVEDVSFEGSGEAGPTVVAGHASPVPAHGIGFSFAIEDPMGWDPTGPDPEAYYLTGAATFHRVRFRYLYKGVQRPAGNLGVHFYDCNWASCYYGSYSVQGKGTAPNVFSVIGGESNGCIAAHFADANTTGFGAFAWINHTFEANSINIRFKCGGVPIVVPPVVSGCTWNESNGVLTEGRPTSADLHAWSGSGATATVTTESVSLTYPFVLDVSQFCFDGGAISGIRLMGANNHVFVSGAKLEQNAGQNGSPFLIDVNDSSYIWIAPNCSSLTGFGNLQKNCRIGPPIPIATSIGTEAAGAESRSHNLPLCSHREPWNGGGGVNQTFETVQTLGATSGVVTAGPPLTGYGNRFQFTPATGNVFRDFSNTAVSVAAGWIFASYEFKNTTGTKNLYVTDGIDKFITAKAPPADGKYYRYGGIAKTTGAVTFKLQMLTQDVVATAHDCEIANFQIWRFDTLHDALDFAASGTYRQADTWIDASALMTAAGNGWVDFGVPYEEAGFYKDTSGVVHLRGLVKNGTTTVFTTIFQLPMGYRPTKPQFFGTASASAYGEVHIAADGSVQIGAGTATWLSLSGISFRAS